MPKTKQVVGLRKMATVDLIKFGEEKRAELFALKFQAVLGSLEQTHRITSIKKEIARVEMVLTEKKKAGENINQVVKADYSKAVDAADQAGKKVRQKHLKALETMQQDDSIASEAAIEQAMGLNVETNTSADKIVENNEPLPETRVEQAEKSQAKETKTKTKKDPAKTEGDK